MTSLEVEVPRGVVTPLREGESVSEAGEDWQEPKGPVVTEHLLEVVAVSEVEALLVSRQVVPEYGRPEGLEGRLVPQHQETVVPAQRQHTYAEHPAHKQQKQHVKPAEEKT